MTPAFEYFLSESQWIEVGPRGPAAAAESVVEAVGRHLSQPVATHSHTRREERETRPAEPAARKNWIVAVGGVILLLTLSYVLVNSVWPPKHTVGETPSVAKSAATTAPKSVASGISEKSIAVLPFADMSEKKDQEYLADGMAEEIINLLAKAPDLRVPARTSSFYFKGKSTKIPDIAHELGVAHVLEGSIRRSGNHLRVTAQLIHASDGYHLWSETYDRDLHDVFKVQDDIANAVVQRLQITLMGGPLTRQRGGTVNVAAYQLYLRAVSAWSQNTKESMIEANGYLNKAVKLDPDFALAWTELAKVALVQTELNVLPPREGLARTLQLAQHALQLSPDLADAHFVLAYVHRKAEWDWAAADAEIRQGLALDPINPLGWFYAGLLSKTLGHWNDAERQIRTALDRDPLFSFALYNLAEVQYLSGHFADAEASFRRLIELAPSFSWTHASLARTLLAEGHPELAVIVAEQEREEEDRLKIMPIVLQAAGRTAEADESFKKLVTQYADSAAYSIAMVYAYRNDSDLALRWLDRAYRQKDLDLIEIIGEPLFKNLSGDPRYKAFLGRMKLPV
jgi:TolB-like protein